MPGNIILTSAFDYSSDFSKAFIVFRRTLAVMHLFRFACSYLHSCELHAQVFDKLLRASKTFDLVARISRRGGVADAPPTFRSIVLRS